MEQQHTLPMVIILTTLEQMLHSIAITDIASIKKTQGLVIVLTTVLLDIGMKLLQHA